MIGYPSWKGRDQPEYAQRYEDQLDFTQGFQTRLDRLKMAELRAIAKPLGISPMPRRKMVENLSQREANKYEQGLVTLGKLLGADSRKPEEEARADAVWRWRDELRVAWEAKSEPRTRTTSR